MRLTKWQRYSSDGFKQDAVRIAQTSGLTRRQVASDLGVGLSTLNKWVKAIADEAGPPDPDLNPMRENERLGWENRILMQENLLHKEFSASQPNQNRRSAQRNGRATSPIS